MVHNFKHKGIKISYSDAGKGNALVFIHGFLEDKSMWNPLVESYILNYRCICVDLFGHGQTENLGYIHTMEEQADMIKALLNSLKLRRYTIIGHSMGGYIALELTKKHPNNIRGIVLQNSTSYPDSEEKIMNRNRAIHAVKANPGLFIQVAIPMLFSEKNRTLLKEEIAEVTKNALNTSTQGIIAALEGMKIRKNNHRVLKETKIHKLMIIGKKDPALDFNSLIQQTENTAVDVKIFSDGHMSHIENFHALQSTYSAFFSKTNS